MLAIGVGLWRDLSRVSEEGGIYFRSTTVLAPIALLLGAWFAVAGRPADEHGYSPSWWNSVYVVLLVVSGIIGLGWMIALH